MIIRCTTVSGQIGIPLPGGFSYNFNINWGDLNSETVVSSGTIVHTYAADGDYDITITENVSGGFPTIRYESSSWALSIKELKQWGTNKWISFHQSFAGCNNLVITATDEAIADTGSVTDFYYAWYNCGSLTSFPLINTSSGTDFSAAWCNCGALTSFPLIDTSSGINFYYTWCQCTSLTSFPLIDTSLATDFYYAWFQCTGLTSFPLLDISSGPRLSSTWYGCTGLTSFPAIDTGAVTDFTGAWDMCTGLTSFPLIDTSSGEWFNWTWDNCPNLTSFPLLNLRKMKQGFACFSHIPTVSYSNILIDLVSNPNTCLFTVGTSKYNPSADAARASLVARGWTIEDAGSAAAITANFTVSSSSGTIPLTVNFTDTSFAEPEYPITSWDWDFGDGSPHSTDPNPSHVYILDGSYTAILTVSNGIDTKSKTLVITPSGWIISAYDPDENSISSLVSVSNEIYGGGVSGRLLKWDKVSAWIEVAGANVNANNKGICTLNDEIYCAGYDGILRKWDNNSAWISLTSSGDAVYSLCVYNGDIYSSGIGGALNKWDGLSAWTEVAPSLSEAIVYSLCVYNNKIYGGALSGRLLEWNGVDSWTEVAPNAISGNRIYCIIVSNNKIYGSGRRNTLLEWNGVNAWVIVAPYILGNASLLTLNSMAGEVYGSITGYLIKWNGVDAWETILHPLSGRSINQLYSLSGIIYGATASGGYLYRYGETPSIVAAFSTDVSSGPAPLTVHFTDESTGSIISWDWDFGDGSSHSTAQNPTHIYDTAGIWTVTLTVWDISNSDFTTTDITVNLDPDFVADVTSGPAPLVAHFTDLSLGFPTGWLWNFGDGSGSDSSPPVSHVFGNIGGYDISLTVTRGPIVNTIIKDDYIRVTGLALDFAARWDAEEPRFTLEFTDISSVIGDAWLWDFGDGTTSTRQNPEHRYKVNGIYRISFTLFISGVPTTLIRWIFAKPPKTCSTVINGTLILDGELTSNGDIQLTSRGALTPIASEKYKKQIYSRNAYITPNGRGRIITSVNNSIGVFGLINGTGQGFGSDQGPGCNSVLRGLSGEILTGYGATHSGLGAINIEAPPPKPSYGNRESPVSLGSGSGYFHVPGEFSGREVRGGGAIKLNAPSGDIVVNGSINMDGDNGIYAGGGSGGSVWCVGWTITGTGSISVRGGTSSLVGGGGGGGGYISFWHAQDLKFSGDIGLEGDGPGVLFTKQIEPILEDRFTGTILNPKWWGISNDVAIQNSLTFTSPQDDYNFPVLDSKFSVSGRAIVAEVGYAPIGNQITVYSAAFLLYSDSRNWIGVARKYNGFYGISSADGIVSSSGIADDYTSTTLRILKSDSTFSFQYYDATNTPITIYSDIRPELEFKEFKLKLVVDKPEYIDSLKVEERRLTPLDIYNNYIETDGTSSDNTAVALNVLGGTSQMYGMDFYTSTNENKVKWDTAGLSLYHTPFQYLLTEYITLSDSEIIGKGAGLPMHPTSYSDIAINVVDGPAQYAGQDYTIANDRIIWNGYSMDGILSPGDVLRVTFFFDPWNVPKFRDYVEWKDVVRTIYPWSPIGPNAIQVGFDNVKIYDGILQNSEAVDPTLYVDSDFGSDSSSGSQLAPLQNLFVATAWAKKGSTVVLYDGTYNPTAVIRKDLTIRGAEGAKPIVTSLYSQDTTGSGWENNAIYFYGCTPYIENLTIKDSTTGIFLERCEDYSISRCSIHDCSTAIKVAL